MPDYQKGKIYKLWSPQGTDEEVYYGSSCDELRFRKRSHKCKANGCNSKILFEKYDDVRIELIEDYPCNNKAELIKREGEYIRENKCLNKIIPDRTKKEYSREHYIKNKKEIAEYQLKNKEKNKEKVAEKMREYQLKNKEKLKEYYREYYRKKKEEALIKE